MRWRGLKKYGLGAGAMLILVMAILLTTGWGSAVAAQITNVFVTNDAAHAVPVAVQGTTPVAGTVNVAKNSTDYAPYEHATRLIQSTNTCSEFTCGISFPAVPAGKRLVITYASARYAMGSGGSFASVTLGVNGNGINEPQINLPAPVQTGGIAGDAGEYLTSGPVAFYAEAGDIPTMFVNGRALSDVDLYTAMGSIVGYLVTAS